MKFTAPKLKSERLTRPVIEPGHATVFGTGVYTEFVIKTVREMGVIVEYIIDNDTTKHGKQNWGCSIISPEYYFSMNATHTPIIIATSPQHYRNIKEQIRKYVDTEVLTAVEILREISFSAGDFGRTISQIKFDLDALFYDYYANSGKNSTVIRSLDIVVTEKCSLKCRDCSNLMQYYTEPVNVLEDPTIESINKIFSSIDWILDVRVIGGEPLINKQLPKFLHAIKQHKNFSNIAIYTNGTIVPRDNLRPFINDSQIYFRISEYPNVRNKVRNLTAFLDANNGNYTVSHVELWQDCGTIKKRHRSPEALQRTYQNCCAKEGITLLHSKLYVCPFEANAMNLGAIPKALSTELSLDELSNNDKTINTWVKQVLSLNNFIGACNYCGGRSDQDYTIKAGIQTKKPIPFNA